MRYPILTGLGSAVSSRWEDCMRTGPSATSFEVQSVLRITEAKVKVRKWIDTPDVKLYEKFVK